MPTYEVGPPDGPGAPVIDRAFVNYDGDEAVIYVAPPPVIPPPPVVINRPPRHRHRRPDIELAVEITSAAGQGTTWHSNARRASERPAGIQLSTRRFEGFSEHQCALPRRIDRDYPDQNLYDGVTVYGADGDVAWEGTVARMPRSMSDAHSVTVGAVGWMAHASERQFSYDYVNRDLAQWGETDLVRRVAQAVAGTPSAKIQASASAAAIVWDLPADPLPNNELSELMFTAATGSKVARIMYRGAREGTFAQFESPVITAADNYAFTGQDVLSVTLDNTIRDLPFTDARQLVIVRARANGAGTPSAGTQQRYDLLAVYGDHGIATLPVDGDADGIAASDVIRHICATACPLLDTSAVTDTSYPIPHVAFRDRTKPYDAFLALNAYHLWELFVWEDRKLHYAPADLSEATWQVGTDDANVTIDLQGDTVDNLANGIEVQFTELGTGRQRTLSPADYTELRDDQVSNPVTAHGRNVWPAITLSFPTTEPGAVQIGRAALAQYNQPKAAGSITIRGHARHKSGDLRPAWKVRAGDAIAITNHPNDRPRLVVDTQYDHDSQTVTVATDLTLQRLEAFFDRVGVQLQARGLA